MTCKNCGCEIDEGYLCGPCREVAEAVAQLEERFSRQEGF